MHDLIVMVNNLPTPFNFVTILVTIIVLIAASGGIISALGCSLSTYMCHRQELEFKREMLDRGMTVNEIEQLIRVRGNDPPQQEA